MVNRHKKLMIVLTLVFLLIQVAVMIGLAAKNYPGFMRGSAVTTGLLLLYTIIEYKYGLYMNNYVRAAVMIAMVCDSFLGQYWEYYITSTLFDKVLHGFGTYSFSLFFYMLLAQMQSNRFNRPVAFVVVFCLGLSFGGLYEIMEFVIDTVTKPTFPGQLSLYDTNLDLVADMAGSLVAATHAALSDLDKNIPPLQT